MYKSTLTALLVSTAVAAGSALAQTSAAPMGANGPGSFVIDQGTSEFRASKFVGLDVYGPDNDKIGDIKDILIGPDGSAKSVVIGIGGFLGLGEKTVAVPWSSLTWSNERPPSRAASNPSPATTGSTMPTGGAPPAVTTAPMTGGVPTATAPVGPARSPAEQAAYNGYPDHATVALTKADLQNAPGFKYYSETHSSSGATSPARP